MRRLLGLSLLGLLAAAASCEDEVVDPGPAVGGGGAAGTGGDGGEPTGCPAAQAACQTEPGGEAECCEVGEVCCSAALNGYSGGDRCAAPGGCPIECPDGETSCAAGQLCQLVRDAWTCVSDCPIERACNKQCCPTGSRCESGECPLPDIAVDEERAAGSARVHRASFGSSSCEILEGCVDGTGERLLLRFDLATPNLGEGDLFMGDPLANQELFQYSACHEHFHFASYADYELLGSDGTVVATGHKQAFCLLDFGPYAEGASTEPVYDCSFQGIQAGWADVYGRRLDCQWVDVTGLEPGEYQLAVSLNSEGVLTESDYENNQVTVPVTIEPDSCATGGCRPFDSVCCSIDNPCGLENDGACDCGGLEPWDQADCTSCYDCLPATRCLGGCTLDGGACCADGDPCGLALNDVCDCGGNYEWDRLDCLSCISDDPECPLVDTCPGGCPAPQGNCCDDLVNDSCNFALDGYCDCGGDAQWDFADCFTCSCND